MTLQPFNMDSCWLYSHLTHRLICWPQPFNTDSCWLYSHLTHRHSCRLNSHLTQMAVDCTAVQHSHKPLSVCLPLDKWSWYPSHSLHNTHTITNCIVQIYQPYPACVCVCVCVCVNVCARMYSTIQCTHVPCGFPKCTITTKHYTSFLSHKHTHTYTQYDQATQFKRTGQTRLTCIISPSWAFHEDSSRPLCSSRMEIIPVEKPTATQVPSGHTPTHRNKPVEGMHHTTRLDTHPVNLSCLPSQPEVLA